MIGPRPCRRVVIMSVLILAPRVAHPQADIVGVYPVRMNHMGTQCGQPNNSWTSGMFEVRSVSGSSLVISLNGAEPGEVQYYNPQTRIIEHTFPGPVRFTGGFSRTGNTVTFSGRMNWVNVYCIVEMSGSRQVEDEGATGGVVTPQDNQDVVPLGGTQSGETSAGGGTVVPPTTSDGTSESVVPMPPPTVIGSSGGNASGDTPPIDDLPDDGNGNGNLGTLILVTGAVLALGAFVSSRRRVVARPRTKSSSPPLRSNPLEVPPLELPEIPSNLPEIPKDAIEPSQSDPVDAEDPIARAKRLGKKAFAEGKEASKGKKADDRAREKADREKAEEERKRAAEEDHKKYLEELKRLQLEDEEQEKRQLENEKRWIEEEKRREKTRQLVDAELKRQQEERERNQREQEERDRQEREEERRERIAAEAEPKSWRQLQEEKAVKDAEEAREERKKAEEAEKEAQRVATQKALDKWGDRAAAKYKRDQGVEELKDPEEWGKWMRRGEVAADWLSYGVDRTLDVLSLMTGKAGAPYKNAYTVSKYFLASTLGDVAGEGITGKRVLAGVWEAGVELGIGVAQDRLLGRLGNKYSIFKGSRAPEAILLAGGRTAYKEALIATVGRGTFWNFLGDRIKNPMKGQSMIASTNAYESYVLKLPPPQP